MAGSGSHDLATQQQAVVLLVILIQALLPQESLREEGQNQEDLDLLTKLSKNSSLSGKLEVSSQAEDGLSIVASLAWGITLSNHGPPNFRSEHQTMASFTHTADNLTGSFNPGRVWVYASCVQECLLLISAVEGQ